MRNVLCTVGAFLISTPSVTNKFLLHIENALLFYIVYYIILYYVMLYYTILHYIMLYYILLFIHHMFLVIAVVSFFVTM